MNTKVQSPSLMTIDVSETDNAYLIEADITGFSARNVSVTTGKESLVIQMVRQHERADSYYLGELEPETYRRIIPLGYTVNDDMIDVKFSNGTLLVAVSKPAADIMPAPERLRASA